MHPEIKSFKLTCRDAFDIEEQLRNDIILLRKQIWGNTEPKACKKRRKVLSDILKTFIQHGADGTRYLKFELGGVDVCKHFFKVCKFVLFL